MDDALARVLVVAGVAGLGLGSAWWARRGAARRAERAVIDVEGFSGRVLLFSDSACGTCDAARRVLDGVGVEYVEVSYGEHPEGMRAAGITSVPLIVVRDEAGSVVGRIAGRPRPSRLRRVLSRAEAA